MRLLVVATGLIVGLSGCVGGSIVHRMPAGNETADASEGAETAGADGEAPSWVLDQGADGKGSDSASFKEPGSDKGDAKDAGSGDPKKDDGSPPPGGNDTSGGGDPEQDPLQQVKDEAPTEGAAGAEGVTTAVEDQVNDVEQSSLPKEPVEEPDAGDLEDTSVSVPTSSKLFPNTDSKLV